MQIDNIKKSDNTEILTIIKIQPESLSHNFLLVFIKKTENTSALYQKSRINTALKNAIAVLYYNYAGWIIKQSLIPLPKYSGRTISGIIVITITKP